MNLTIRKGKLEELVCRAIPDCGDHQVMGDTMAGSVMQLPKMASAAAITLCLGLILVAPIVPPLLGLGHGVPQSNPPQNSDAKPKAHSVELKWKASPSVVVGYNVYRANHSEGPFTKLNSSPVRETNYKDTKVQASNTYFYRVTAIDAEGRESEFTGHIKIVVPSP